ncbi:hypothetical protein A2382_03970 [Candidatus Woesebacteria bacterium RIFOXYB1_FULL_38_16]|uniref:Uncharacterized protein n=1 Tax=Candidatus Woesebacteria bacterium RIFOXYB1_FULL_38_16 TaxID=1802538 RepID=A0A1F8CT52_9BACT|nr:MAG: hypothetical protein A2191_04575 [Candidatus Woesebacteria bacterium RIFOXYA1_FULL_38_9]OGM78999.1 MAG: hypothetical protein A2382_03970 [Candidatus Woesebacteria bacterium RIFOXYB1_FULL_38_16]
MNLTQKRRTLEHKELEKPELRRGKPKKRGRLHIQSVGEIKPEMRILRFTPEIVEEIRIKEKPYKDDLGNWRVKFEIVIDQTQGDMILGNWGVVQVSSGFLGFFALWNHRNYLVRYGPSD